MGWRSLLPHGGVGGEERTGGSDVLVGLVDVVGGAVSPLGKRVHSERQWGTKNNKIHKHPFFNVYFSEEGCEKAVDGSERATVM